MADFVSMNRGQYFVDNGNESKVIIRDLADIPGGRALNVTAYTEEVIRAGHIIKHDKVSGSYAPLGVTAGAYDALTGDEEYAGVLKCSILAAKPAAAIMTVGEVNTLSSPYPVTDAIKAGLPQIKFLY